jgi:thioredoxin-like negative regulator of GroEL
LLHYNVRHFEEQRHMDTPANNTPPDALLLLGTRCPHCPTVLNALAAMVKAGVIGTLRAVNIEQRPDIAQELGVRSVPWVRIGPFELEGLRSEKELRDWAAKAGTTAGLGAWLDELLATGEIKRALALVQSEAGALDALLQLFADRRSCRRCLSEALPARPRCRSAGSGAGSPAETAGLTGNVKVSRYPGM